MRYMVSACLLGENCKYNGKNNQNNKLIEFLRDKEVVSICPEVLGGLSTPRLCCERKGKNVLNSEGEDVTSAFLLGAKKALAVVLTESVDVVITQPRSPSCGKGYIYDGSFEKKLIEGNGCFVDMLMKQGIDVQTVDEFLGKLKE